MGKLKELIAKRADLIGTVKTLQDECAVSLEAGEFDKVKALQDKIDGYQANITAFTTQIKSMQLTQAAENEVLVADEDQPAEPQKSAKRAPFDDPQPEPENSVAKAINILRHGTLNDQTEILIKDLYGTDYGQKRVRQREVFAKYLRKGRFDTLEDETLLKTAILLPEQIADGVKQDVSYKTMKATLQEVSGELGGFVVPEDWRAELLQRLQGLTVVRPRARKITTTRDAVEWPRLLGGNNRYTSAVRVSWIEEVPSNASAAESNPTFGTLRIPVNTQLVRTNVSKNLVEDSAIDIASLLAQLYAEAMAIDEDEMFLTGAGGSTPKGVLGNRSGAEKTPDDGVGAIASGNATALEPDGLIDLVYGLDAQYRQGAVMVAATATHGAVRKMKTGDSQYLWQMGLQAGEPATLLNYPFYESEAMPAVSANSYPVIFGQMNAILVADRIGMTISRVEDTNTHGQNQVAFFGRRRLGAGVIEPYKLKVQKVATSV